MLLCVQQSTTFSHEKNDKVQPFIFEQTTLQKQSSMPLLWLLHKQNSEHCIKQENPITLFHCKSSSSPRIPSIRPLDNPYSRCNVQSTTTNRIQIEVTSIWRVRSERAKDSLSTELITLLISTSWRCSWGSILHIHRKCKLCIASWRAPNKKNAFSTRSSV